MAIITLTKTELEKILTLMSKHGNTTVTINSDNSSGIGPIVTAELDLIISGTEGKFTVEITGVDSW